MAIHFNQRGKKEMYCSVETFKMMETARVAPEGLDWCS